MMLQVLADTDAGLVTQWIAIIGGTSAVTVAAIKALTTISKACAQWFDSKKRLREQQLKNAALVSLSCARADCHLRQPCTGEQHENAIQQHSENLIRQDERINGIEKLIQQHAKEAKERHEDVMRSLWTLASALKVKLPKH